MLSVAAATAARQGRHTSAAAPRRVAVSARRLARGLSGLIGALIGYERRVHHKAIGVAGMVLVAIGSTSYMLLGLHLGETDPSSVSRTLQGFLSGIGFLGGAVIFKSGYDVKGIKAAAAVWITGASGLAIATSYWLLGLTVGLVTAIIMFVSDSFPDEDRRRRQEP